MDALQVVSISTFIFPIPIKYFCFVWSSPPYSRRTSSTKFYFVKLRSKYIQDTFKVHSRSIQGPFQFFGAWHLSHMTCCQAQALWLFQALTQWLWQWPRAWSWADTKILKATHHHPQLLSIWTSEPVTFGCWPNALYGYGQSKPKFLVPKAC